VRAVLIGVVTAGVAGWTIVQLLRRFWIPDYLQNSVILALVVMLFALSNHWQHESGLLTVTLLGIFLANQRTVTVHHVIEFKENLRVLLMSALFIVLAADVNITGKAIAEIGGRALLFVATLILVVRPLATLAATVGSDLSWRERVFVGWIHPRGIVTASVASLFALELADGPFATEAENLAFVAFAVIVGTVVVYGLTLGPLARRLDLARPDPQGILFAGASPLVQELALAVQQEGVHVVLVDTNPQKVAHARMAGLPVWLASIGSELVRQQIDFGDLGRLLAMTSNDEVNALATMEFTEQFGRAEVYQLVPREPPGGRHERVPAHRRGRLLFHKNATFEYLEQRFRAGHQIKKTMISDDFTFKHFVERYGDTAVVLMVIDGNGRITINTTDQNLQPKPGQKVIALVEPADGLRPDDIQAARAEAASASAAQVITDRDSVASHHASALN
jgi:hypothetical protein